MRHSLLAFMLMLMLSMATAQSLLISPLDDINLTVDEEQFANILFTIFNDENISINISINTTFSLEPLVFFSNDNFIILANSTVNVSCIIRRDIPATGKIFFNYNLSATEINVSITEDGISGDIVIVPSQPTSESSIVFIIPERESGTGYMIFHETNKVYLIEVNDGIGFVELDGDYGSASIVIFCGEKKYTTEIDIDAYFQGELTIDMPSTTVINEATTFQVFASGAPIQAEIQFRLGETFFSKTTDADGVVSFTFTQIGNWTVTAKVFNVEQIQNIYVAQKPIEITLPSYIYIDQEITISVNKRSDVLISFNELSWKYITDEAGNISFTPTFPGKHSVHVTAHDFQEDRKDFIVYADIIIVVRNEEDKEVSVIKPNTLYGIYVTDKNNKPVASKLEVYADGELINEMNIAGSAIWRSNELRVTYEFKASPSETGYVEESLTLYGKEETMDMGIMMSGITVGIACAILILLYIFKRDWFYSAHEKSRKWLRSRRKLEAPI